MKKTFLGLAFIIILNPFLTANIIDVPGDQPTIQDAIEVASSGDTVLAAPGTYFENINFKGKNITVASHFILANDLSFVESTIIDGSQPFVTDTASCVLFISGEDSTAVLTGFTLTGGTGTVWEDEHYLNHWYTEGGGILIQYSSPTIKNNIIKDNEAINVPAGVTSAGGGAIRSGDSNPHILNNLILSNQGRYGAGIVLNYSGAIIKNNIIAYNTGGEDYGGGGLWCLGNGTNPKIIENNTIVENSSALGGGGIRIWSSTVSISNSILWGNTANTGLQIQGNGFVSYSNVEGGYNGVGNLDEDPLFEVSNFILSDDSPCIDAGTSGLEYYDPEDPQNPGYALFPAKGELTNDMGAYGGPGCLEFPDFVTGIEKNVIDIGEIDFRVFPNPVTGDHINLEIKNAGSAEVTLQIVNCKGINILNENFATCDYMYTKCIEIPNLERGIYFIRLIYRGDKLLTKKIMID